MSTATPTRPTPTRSAGPQPRSPKALASSIDPLRVLRRHVAAIIISAIVGGILGVIAYFAFYKIYPLYTARVLFEVQPGLQQAGQVGTIDLSDDNMVFRIAQTETYMLTSREVLDTAINRNPDVRKMDWYQSFIEDDNGKKVFNSGDALDELEEDLRTSVVRGSNLFSLSWSTHRPEDASVLLNAIADAYMDNRKARDRGVYDYNLNLFQDQLTATQKKLDDLAKEMRNLIKNSRMTELEGVWRSAQAMKQEELTKQLADATQAWNLAQTAFQLNSEKLKGHMQPTSQDIFESERDPSLANQIDYIQALNAQLRNLFETRNPDDPMVVSAQARLRATEDARDAKLKEIINRNLEAKQRMYGDEVTKYESSVKKLEEELAKNQKLMEDLAGQQSDYDALKMRREHLEMQRTAEQQLMNEVQLMRLRADASRVRSALRALTPREPSFPKPEIMIPLGVLLLVGITLGVVFLRELTDQRVKSASDLAVIPGVNVIGSIPDLIDDPTKTDSAELVVRSHPRSVLAESYRQAAATLLPMIDRNAHQTLLLVGGLPGSGTTTVATNLATAAASTGKRVLAIDANFRRPRLAEAMGIAGDNQGLADLLNGSASIDQVLVDAGNGVSVIAAGTPANRVFDRLNNGNFESLLAELRGRFDLIIFDAPPAVVSGDAWVLANKVDAAVLVVRAHQEHRGLVARMINRLSEARCEMLGVLLNRPRGIAGGYLKKNYAAMAEYTNPSS